MNIVTWKIVLILTAGLLSSCAINPNLNDIRNTPEDAEITMPLMPQTPTVNERMTNQYRLGFGDVVEVKFFNHGEYNQTVAVRPDGKISLQRVGDIDVTGMPVSTLDTIITQTYEKILVNPDVTVIVTQFGGQFVYVMGEVNQPGSYDVSKGMTVLRAIATAGGPLNSAQMNSVVLIRANEYQNLYARRLNLVPADFAAIRQNDSAIQPYDLIYVPKTFVSDLEVFINQIYNIIMPPLNLAARFHYYQTWSQ